MISSLPLMNSERLRQRLSTVYASATRCGSRVFQASSALRTLAMADSRVNGGAKLNGEGLVMGFFLAVTGGRIWLGGLDSNQDNQSQSLMYCRLYDLPVVHN